MSANVNSGAASHASDGERSLLSPVLLDISRLIWRARRAVPSGIDRVELNYAQHFLAADAVRPAHAVVHLWGFLFGISGAGARRFVHSVSSRWQSGATFDQNRRNSGVLALYGGLLLCRWTLGFQLRRWLRRFRGKPVFLVVSHHHLSRPATIGRIQRIFQARCACFLHDLIPLESPEYFPVGFARKHERIVATIRDLFDLVIVNSQTTAESLARVLAQRENEVRVPKIGVVFPGARTFSEVLEPSREPSTSTPFFIVLGTLEPRKNHLLLLNIWTRLSATLETPPRLLVIGARGWENEQVVDMLERSRRLRGLVEEHGSLSDRKVASLMRYARAVLVPSFAEGFGSPLAEALAAGVPVICSDIPVFREIGAGAPEYVDPFDFVAWRDAIVDYSAPDSVRRALQLQRLNGWRAPTWSDHMSMVEELL
jgi:glycosyltransferase involved in cell wall biosynthesis